MIMSLGMSALVGFQIFENLSLGYSYGIPSNEISNSVSMPTHEIFLRLDIFSKGSGESCFIEQPTCNFSLSTVMTNKSCLSPIVKISSG